MEKAKTFRRDSIRYSAMFDKIKQLELNHKQKRENNKRRQKKNHHEEENKQQSSKPEPEGVGEGKALQGSLKCF